MMGLTLGIVWLIFQLENLFWKECKVCWYVPTWLLTNTTLTLIGFDDQERNLTFVKTYFQISKLIFHACNFKQAFFLFINHTLRDLDKAKILLFKLFFRYLVVKCACLTGSQLETYLDRAKIF